MEDRAYAGDNTVASQDLGCLSYHSLFGGVNGGPLPFSLVLKALLAVAELVVGVPTGPTHLAMARSGLPTIGIWLTHHPSWYDEPRNLAINIVSKNVWASELGSRVGSFSARDSYDYNIRHSDTLTISGELVSSVVEELIG